MSRVVGDLHKGVLREPFSGKSFPTILVSLQWPKFQGFPETPGTDLPLSSEHKTNEKYFSILVFGNFPSPRMTYKITSLKSAERLFMWPSVYLVHATAINYVTEKFRRKETNVT
jgi:hypothetical protein